MTGETPVAAAKGRTPAAATPTRDRPDAAGGRAGEEDRSALLARAGMLLSASLDYTTTLASLARVAVPQLADWCAVDVVGEDGAVQRIVTAHPDPAKERMAEELAERYPPDPSAAAGVPRVLSTGEPELVPDIPEQLLRSAARDEEHLRLILELGLRSYMVVPLNARGRTLGAISLVSAESGRRYDEGDLRFAEEIAARAAIAVDNALLYREAERARERADRLLESITDAFFALDAEGRFSYLNDEAERILLRPRAELLGRPVGEVLPERPGSRFAPMCRAAVAEQRAVHFEEHHPPLDAWFEVRAFPSEGGLAIFLRDVTAQKRAREALRDSERRFRFMADAIPVQVWTARADGSLDYVSRRTAEYFGVPAEQVLDAGWQDVLHPDQLPLVMERWSHSLRTGEPYEVEFLLRGADGAYRWHLGRATAERDESGAVVRWFGSNTDIHARKTGESERERLMGALDAERTRLQDIFREAPAFIATLRGPEHRFETANPRYYQLVGHRDILGLTVAEALPEVVEQGFVELLDGVFRDGVPFVGDEVPIALQRTRGAAFEQHFLNFVYQPIVEADGGVSGIFVHGVDVTDQVLARQEVERKAEELLRLTRQLEATNRELDQFAYVASHDLKAPLRGIANLSQWIEEDLEAQMSPEVREHMEMLRGRVTRMEGLIDGILLYSRAGRAREEPETVDVRHLVDEVVDLLAPRPGAVVEVGEGMPVLRTERLPLQQVFLNLIGNALKYDPREDARVRVAARPEGAAWRFTVADDGPGIAPQYHERIFGIFQTLHARDEVEGTGIGLSIVKKFVESRGGRVWVESEEGAGAAFHFLWPADNQGEV